MKKFGFTLMEVLISIAIIGIVSAIVVPQIVGLFPDENKLKVLKIQKMLTEINAELLNDKGIYYQELINGSLCIGFACEGRPFIEPYNIDYYDDHGKYTKLLADKLNYDRNNTNSLGQEPTGNFYTPDGIYWEIFDFELNNILGNPQANTITYTLLVDLNGDGVGVDCPYNPAQCTNPDRFEFTIDTYGKVTGRDPLTRAYLENPDRVNDKTVDFARAKNIYVENSKQKT